MNPFPKPASLLLPISNHFQSHQEAQHSHYTTSSSAHRLKLPRQKKESKSTREHRGSTGEHRGSRGKHERAGREHKRARREQKNKMGVSVRAKRRRFDRQEVTCRPRESMDICKYTTQLSIAYLDAAMALPRCPAIARTFSSCSLRPTT